MKEIIIDFNFIKDNLHKYFMEKFSFPSYYGENLDALFDCLTQINEKTLIIFINSNKYKNFNKILQVFNEAKDENVFLNLKIEN